MSDEELAQIICDIDKDFYFKCDELAQIICDIDKDFYFKCDELGISFGLIRQTEDEFLNEVFKDQ